MQYYGQEEFALDPFSRLVQFVPPPSPLSLSLTLAISANIIPIPKVSLSHTIFIDRTSATQSIAAMTAAAHHIAQSGQSVFIFPEGTRSYSEHADLLPFKKGAFHLAVQAQVPIVPVVSANYSDVLNVRRRIFRAATIPVRVLEPVETVGMRGKEDVEALAATVRERMLVALGELTAEARKSGVAVKDPVASASDAVAEGLATGSHVDADVAKVQRR